MPIIAAAIVSAIDAVEQRRFPVVTYALLGGATFLRMDAAVVFLAVAATLVAYERRSRVQHALLAVLVLAAALGVQTAARFAYYGAPVPNTYYLKMTGYPVLWRAAWGLRYLAGTIWRQQPLLYVIVAVPLIARRLRTPGVVIAAAVVASQFLYSVYAGMMDNRFVTTVMPLVFVLFAIGLRTVVGELATAFQRVMHRRDVMFAVACGVAALMFGGGVSPWREAMVNPPTDEGLLERAEILERLTTPDASVAVVAAGTLPYLLRRPAIDLLGKNDSKVARADAHVEYRLFSTPFLSGHVKWDYGYSIGQLKPDVIADLWRDPDDARPYLDAYVPVTITEHRLFLRRGSPHVRWDRIAREPKVTIDAN